LGSALFEDALRLEFREGATIALRYSHLARVTAQVQTSAPVVVATIKPGSFAAAEQNQTTAEQFDVDLNLAARRLQILARNQERGSRVSLADADVVVAGGRGLGSVEEFTRLVEKLAARLGAAVGATRAVVDAGWRPYAEQVGQTGKTVQPKVYIALGISGAVQHLSGMNKSRFIIAINKDRDAPIFRFADLGVVGDVGKLVPAILTKLP
jgi:electron transfer flavoprotein alpha subunit